ncbi:siderophore-interacting protein [Pseudonocardia abyssalis]|uniref:Siderophore-interacting protein n=1 Tax=Pseudonocardia abyssalis TaxID=2792008 RepID=A0ABS6URQ6_9PSEU|nr:siderophore-interacting protein [Pseudonocardia abyssalis]MBW0114952.1 siderophore-interacting protein [Pseudonocardia abyssalis]MBW0134621.1 siderophore-interacting protein [Pseudonocardia abyssalis]
MSTDEVTARQVEVREVVRLSPSLVRVRLGGPDLDGFESLGVPDEGCVLHFPAGPDGEPDPEIGRWYTVRRIDAGLLTVDVVLHEGGSGGEWAAVARVGDRLRITHRNSWYRRPESAEWQLLVGDVTALPTIGRIVEETASTVPTTVLVEVPDTGDAQPLDGVDATWVHRPRLATEGSGMEALVRSAVLPDSPGYVYVAGEAAATRAVRKYLRHEAGLPTGSYGVVGYWRVDGECWKRRYAESGVDTVALYQAAQAEAERVGGGHGEEVRDIYERKLAEVGLL